MQYSSGFPVDGSHDDPGGYHRIPFWVYGIIGYGRDADFHFDERSQQWLDFAQIQLWKIFFDFNKNITDSEVVFFENFYKIFGHIN